MRTHANTGVEQRLYGVAGVATDNSEKAMATRAEQVLLLLLAAPNKKNILCRDAEIWFTIYKVERKMQALPVSQE